MTSPSVRDRIRSIESAAIAGVVYAILAIVALSLLRRLPEVALSDTELQEWFSDAEQRATPILALNLATISAVAFLWFVAVIRRRLGDMEDRFFATVFLGSAILYLSMWVTAAAVLAAPAVAFQVVGEASIDSASASLAGGIAGALLLVAAPRVQALFVFSTSTLILRSGVLPRWLAYLGYAVGVMLFAIPLVIEPIGVGFPVWVLIVSATMLARRRRDRPLESPNPPTTG